MARRTRLPTVEERLARLGELRVTIEAADGAYRERLAIWRSLLDEKVARSTIAEASGVGVTAIGYQLHKARKAEDKATATRK